MDMTIPTVLILHIGGNLILFWGLFKLLSITVFKTGGQPKEPQVEKRQEIKRLERELRRV